MKMRRHWKTNALFLSFCCTGVVLWIIYRNDHPIQTYTQGKKKVNFMEKINKTPKTQLNKKLMEPHGKLQNTKNITNAKLQKYLLQPHTNIHHTKNKNKRYSHGEDKTMRIKDYLGAPYPYHEVQNAKERYSQANQDQVVYDILQKKGGFFVELGAYDGQLYSNSLWFERQHRWTGLLIEANPELCRKIDQLKRNAWRLCACVSNTLEKVTFIKGGALGGVESHIDKHHMKTLNRTDKVSVPCFSMESVLNEINTYHIDFYSLDVEGAEMTVLESMRDGLKSHRFTVDVWSIEYRVWDGKQIVYEKSLDNLNSLRRYFKRIGGYSEHSQLSNDGNVNDGYALDVVFVRNEIYCKKHKLLPDGSKCSNPM